MSTTTHDPDVWLAAAIASHERLAADVAALSPDQVAGPSYDTEWSIAQVLSHLGSGAEIFTLFLRAGLDGGPVPGMAEFEPIWARWNAKAPADQAADALVADLAFLDQVAALDESQRRDLRFDLFGSEQGIADLLRFRLGEHALHTWDVEVQGDPEATLPADATGLLIDPLDQLVGRVGRLPEEPLSVHITTDAPARRFVLESTDAVELRPADGTPAGGADLELPAEALIRLVYGRLDPEHTPPTAGDADLDALRRVFPGV